MKNTVRLMCPACAEVLVERDYPVGLPCLEDFLCENCRAAGNEVPPPSPEDQEFIDYLLGNK